MVRGDALYCLADGRLRERHLLRNRRAGAGLYHRRLPDVRLQRRVGPGHRVRVLPAAVAEALEVDTGTKPFRALPTGNSESVLDN